MSTQALNVNSPESSLEAAVAQQLEHQAKQIVVTIRSLIQNESELKAEPLAARRPPSSTIMCPW